MGVYAMTPKARWAEEDWRVLSPSAKLLYLQITTSAKVSACGGATLAVKQWARRTGLTEEEIHTSLDELAEQGWLAVDRTTDEVGAPRYVMDDAPKNIGTVSVARAVWAAWSTIESASVRQAILDHLPAKCWEVQGVEPGTPRSTSMTSTVEPTMEVMEESTMGPTMGVTMGVIPVPHTPSPSPAAAPPPRRLTSDERSGILNDAVELLLLREGKHDTAETKGNPTAWLGSARAGRRSEVQDQAFRLLADHPDWQPTQLADALSAAPGAARLAEYRADPHQPKPDAEAARAGVEAARKAAARKAASREPAGAA